MSATVCVVNIPIALGCKTPKSTLGSKTLKSILGCKTLKSILGCKTIKSIRVALTSPLFSHPCVPA